MKIQIINGPILICSALVSQAFMATVHSTTILRHCVRNIPMFR